METYQERLINDLKKLREYYKDHQKKSDLTYDFPTFYSLDSLASPILGFSFGPTSLLKGEREAIMITTRSYKDIIELNNIIRKEYNEIYELFSNLDNLAYEIDYPLLPYYKHVRGFSEKDFTDILLSFLSEQGNDFYNLAKKYMDEDRIIMGYKNEGVQTAMYLGIRMLQSGYILMRHSTFNTYSLSSLIHEFGHAYDREKFMFKQQKRINNFQDILLEVPSSFLELEFYDYLIRNKINDKGAQILKNERLSRMFDTYATIYDIDETYFKEKNRTKILGKKDYKERCKIREELIYGLGIYIGLHLQYLKNNMSDKEFMKEFYNLLSSRKERTITESIEGLGINIDDFISGTYVYPTIKESSKLLKKTIQKL